MHSTRFLSCCSTVLLVLSLNGCAYFIPDSANALRYNRVSGDRHVPALNNQPVSQPMQGSQNTYPTGNAVPVDNAMASVPNFPPVDAATQARAQQEIASMPLPEPTVPSVPTPTFSPAELPPANLGSGRHVPVENAASTMTVSQNNYPDLATVPPRPPITGNDSAADRLARVRDQLERDRANSDTARDRLVRDAASEPSLLQNRPETTGTVPPPAPVMETPIPPPLATTPVPQVNNAPRPGVIAQVPSPVFAPPPPPMTSGGLPPATVSIPPVGVRTAVMPAPMPVASVSIPAPMNTMHPAPPISFAPAPSYMPAPVAQAAPIILRPPAGDVAMANIPAPSFQATPVPQWNAPQPLPPASSGGFDPMAGSAASGSTQSATVYAATGYLPDSRYIYQR